jgi:hypothetical protein
MLFVANLPNTGIAEIVPGETFLNSLSNQSTEEIFVI